MKTLLKAALLLTLVPGTAQAQINAGQLKPEPDLPFTLTQVATFNLPWRIAFLPDGRMLVTEKVGPVWLVTQQGEKTPRRKRPGRSRARRTLGCRPPDSRRAGRAGRALWMLEDSNPGGLFRVTPQIGPGPRANHGIRST